MLNSPEPRVWLCVAAGLSRRLRIHKLVLAAC